MLGLLSYACYELMRRIVSHLFRRQDRELRIDQSSYENAQSRSRLLEERNDRLTASGHGSPGYGAGASGAGGRGAASSLHHAVAISPYFPPPFHHAAPSPQPQQHLEYLADPYGVLSWLHHYNQLGLRRDGDPNHAHVVNEQLSRPKYRNRLIVQKVTKNLDLINDLRRAFLLQDLVEYPRTPYIVTSVSPFSSEFQLVLSKFEMKNKLIFRVRQILKVENTFLMLQYQLMARNWRYACAQECLLFHGTKEENLNGICRNNFDRSKIVNSKFGRGVSFARDAFYASHYHHDNKRNPDKVMVLTKVLFGELDFGYKDMVVPRAPSYTSKNLEGSVVVKYDDASFYPAYIIRYSGMHSNKTLRKCC